MDIIYRHSSIIPGPQYRQKSNDLGHGTRSVDIIGMLIVIVNDKITLCLIVENQNYSSI